MFFFLFFFPVSFACHKVLLIPLFFWDFFQQFDTVDSFKEKMFPPAKTNMSP